MIHNNFVLSFNGKNLLKNDKEMNWERNIFQVTTSTDGHGSITATPMSGYQGTTVSLSNMPNAGYNFNNYELTGASLTGNQFVMNNDVTAKANFSLPPKTIYGSLTKHNSYLGTVFTRTPIPTAYASNIYSYLTINGDIIDVDADGGVEPLVTVWANEGYTVDAYKNHSAYYDNFTFYSSDKITFSAWGLNKEIHISAISGKVDGSNPYWIRISSASNGPWIERGLIGTDGRFVIDGFDWAVNDKVYVQWRGGDQVINRFTGYVLE